MSVRALLVVVLVYLHLFAGSVSSAFLSDDWIDRSNDMMKTYKVAKYIEDNYKGKLHLEYKDFNDLHETCTIVLNFCKYDKVFKPSDVLSIIARESKFNQYAVNKNDGGKGLGQLTAIPVNWKEELFWIKDPFDKYQNISGIFIALNSLHKSYGSKKMAIKRYNGSTHKSTRYANEVLAFSKKIEVVNL